ncbi:MAG TPA: LysR family transcriptional regulator [Kofleriaceae bacterium]|nr:LysR family transcriptional regulator [Kofleriaceae bacterium]
MEIRQLQAFAAIARIGSFTQAARDLGVAQPALSQRLRALELELGVVLVERGNRTGGLTEAGRDLLPRAERILAEVHDAGEQLAAHAGLARGTVRLGCALQTLLEGRLAPLLARFHAAHAGIRILVHEAHTQQVLELLGRGEVDLGLVHLGRAGDGATVGAEAARAGLTLLQLAREPLVVIAAPGHPLAGRAGVRLDDLHDHDFVSFGPGATLRRLISDAAAARGVELRIVCSTANMGTVRAAVAAGLGISIVPASGAEVPWPALRAVPLVEPRLERIITLARSSARYESPAMTALRHALADELRAPARRDGLRRRRRRG